MKEKPIIFSGPMVNAILEGRKTQTRRIVKPQPELFYRLTGERISVSCSNDPDKEWRPAPLYSHFSELGLHGWERWSDLLSYKIQGLWEEGVRGLVLASRPQTPEGVLDCLFVPQQQEINEERASSRVHGISRDAEIGINADSASRRKPKEQQAREPSMGDAGRKLAGQRSARKGDEGGETPQREVLKQGERTHTMVCEDGSVQPRARRSYFGGGAGVNIRNCPFIPLTRLWVRENFYVMPDMWAKDHGPQPIHYAADVADRNQVEDYASKPSIHMPRWASRLTLLVKSVRVERVQDITEEDAKAEGFDSIESFLTLFYDVNKRAPRTENPWVWVVEFERVKP